ncbi:hypothetical protein MC885_014909 [Smutsia gigantea]|nr:hypothetical protein MC885_014909 [Smutsia gigantea]
MLSGKFESLFGADLIPGTGLAFVCFADALESLSADVSCPVAGLKLGERKHTPRPYTASPRPQLLAPPPSRPPALHAGHAEGRPLPASLARGQTGPVQSPPGARPPRTRPQLPHSGRTPGLGSAARPWEKAAPASGARPGPPEGAGRGCRRSPCALAAGARVGLGAQRCTLYADGSRPERRATSLVRGWNRVWEKFVPRGGQRAAGLRAEASPAA